MSVSAKLNEGPAPLKGEGGEDGPVAFIDLKAQQAVIRERV